MSDATTVVSGPTGSVSPIPPAMAAHVSGGAAPIAVKHPHLAAGTFPNTFPSALFRDMRGKFSATRFWLAMWSLPPLVALWRSVFGYDVHWSTVEYTFVSSIVLILTVGVFFPSALAALFPNLGAISSAVSTAKTWVPRDAANGVQANPRDVP